MKYTDAYLKDAHQHCRLHREDAEGGRCGCFHCLAVFDGSEVTRWIDRRKLALAGETYERNTAMCPRCGLDMVLPERRGLPVRDPEFLRAMRRVWVETTYALDEIEAAQVEGREPEPHVAQ